MRIQIAAALSLAFSLSPAESPETLRWELLHGDGGQVRGTAAAAARDGAGNLYVVGYVYNTAAEDILLLKYSPSGAMDRSFGRGGYQVWDGGIGSDRATGVAVDGSGAVYVSGYTFNGTNDDAILLKYDGSGHLDTGFGTQGMISFDSGTDDRAQGVGVDASGTVVLAGFTGDHVLVRRYSASGTYDTTFGTSPVVGRANAVAIDTAGNVYVGGHIGGWPVDDFLLLKYSPAGSLISSLTYDHGFEERAFGIAVTPAGEIVLVGEATDDVGSSVLVVKYDASMAFSWSAIYDSFLDEFGMAVAIGAAGEIYVAGYTSDLQGGGGNEDALLLKYTAAGAPAFAKTYDGGQHDRGYGVAIDGSGGALLVGGTRLDVYSLEDILVVSYSSMGAVNATISKSGFEAAYAVSFGPGGDIYATGQRWNGVGFDAFTTKIRPDGTTDPVFGTRVFGGGGDAAGNGIAVDAAGNAYVGVSMSSWGISAGIAILKYSATGIVDAGFNAQFAFSNQDGVGAVGLDPAGYVIVVGSRISTATGYTELFVLRLDPATGALDPSFSGDGIQTYSNPAGWVYGSGLAFDGAGRIYVSGSSDNKILLVRLTPDGEFDATFGGGAVVHAGGGLDWAGAVAIDAFGRPLVTGSVYNGLEWDLAVLRYDVSGSPDPSFGTNGVFTYATSAFDFGNGIAIGPTGSVYVAGETGSTFGLLIGDLLLVKLTPDGVPDLAFDGDGIAVYDSGLGRDVAISVAAGNGIVVAGTRGQAELWLMKFAPPDPDPMPPPTAGGGGCTASAVARGGSPIEILAGMLAVLASSLWRHRTKSITFSPAGL